jgi:hypothetical protein
MLLGAGLACIYAIDAATVFGSTPIAGAVLVAIAAMQACWLRAARALRPRALIASAALNLALTAVWLLSRTVGLPVGSSGPQPVGLLDALCAADSIAVVVLATSLMGTPARLASRATALLQKGSIVLAVASLSSLSAAAHAQSSPARAGAVHGVERHYFCQLL